MNNKNENPARRNLTKHRVLVFKVDAPRRPIVIISGDQEFIPTNSEFVFGDGACQMEADRRREIYDLMTDDEREVFAKYGMLRD